MTYFFQARNIPSCYSFPVDVRIPQLLFAALRGVKRAIAPAWQREAALASREAAGYS
jgi:hypothetical protein